MAKGLLFLYISMMATFIYCYCPDNKVRSFGPCSFHIVCSENIRDVSLPPQCQGSNNFKVNIDLVLNNAVETFDEHIVDTNFLSTVTSFKVTGNWPQTNLSMLEYMPRLQKLILVDNHIKNITGSPFFHLSRLEHLDVSNNNLTDIEHLFQFEIHPNKMEKLLLAHNAIKEIPADAFGELSSLTELDLSYNKISDLTEEPFRNLTMLKVLRLDKNTIIDLNGAVNNLHNLRHLFLRGNQIQSISDQSLMIINDLETFDISMNQLENVEARYFVRHWEHFGINSVCKIILSDNQITSVPNVILKELLKRYTRSLRGSDVTTELDLSKNEISDIGYNAFQAFIHLVSLDLSHNKIINFDVDPQDMIHVRYLNLNSNFITQINFESLRSMNSLQNLDLSNNNLENIPDLIFPYNVNLKQVNFSNNEIEKVENFKISMFHPKGGILDLSNNNISKLSIHYGDRLRLTILILRSNKICDPSYINLSYQRDLESVDISQNCIKELNELSLYLPVGLTSLDLSSNEIHVIQPATFHRVENLKTLKLGMNKLSEIEYGTFQALKQLTTLDLSYNNITYLDSKVMMDLISLRFLSLKFNGLVSLDYKGWLGHKFELTVYLDGNNFSCDWLAEALSDYNNDFSKMKPVVLVKSLSQSSLEGIPCEKSEIGQLMATAMADERLLVLVQKILKAVEKQNLYMHKYFYETSWKKTNEINT